MNSFKLQAVDSRARSGLRLPFCQTTLTAKRPPEKAYPRELRTIGDHIRKRRLDLKLLQKEVARLLGVDTTTVTNWEKNRCGPTLRILPSVIEFVGYSPFQALDGTLGQQIKSYRKTIGMSQKKMARQIRVDPTTLSRLERSQGRQLVVVLHRYACF